MESKKINFKLLIILGLLGLVFIVGCSNYNNETKDNTNKIITKSNTNLISYEKTYETFHNSYKKVLFATGQEKEESKQLITKFYEDWNELYSKYKNNAPSKYTNYRDWNKDLDKLNNIILEAKQLINENKLHEAHLKLEQIRPIWQKIFDENKEHTVEYYMTEFHERMEKIVEYSNQKNITMIKEECNETKELWNKVYNTNKINNEDIEKFNSMYNQEKNNIDIICQESDVNRLNEESNKLKKDFVKMYLIFG